MILSFHDKDAAKLWQGQTPRRWPVELRQAGLRKLRPLGHVEIVDYH
jgi:plasmid maintenance system killer protein